MSKQLLAVLLLISHFSWGQRNPLTPKPASEVLDSLASALGFEFTGIGVVSQLLCPVAASSKRDYRELIGRYCENRLVGSVTKGINTLVKATPYGDSVLRQLSTILYLRHGQDEPVSGLLMKVNGQVADVSDTAGLIVVRRLHTGDTLTFSGTVQALDTQLIYQGQPLLRIDLTVKVRDMDTAKVSNGYGTYYARKAPFFADKRLAATTVVSSSQGPVMTALVNRLVQWHQLMSTPVAGGTSPTGTIHGTGSLRDNSQLQYMLDGLPMPYPDLINSLDVRSVTANYDAPAISLHGTRGANGSLQVELKDATNEQAGLTVTTITNIGQWPDLSDRRVISAADALARETEDFQQGVYDSRIRLQQPLLPHVALLAGLQQKTVTQPRYDSLVALYRQHDLQRELNAEFFQRPIWQQTAVQYAGRYQTFDYYVSLHHTSQRLPERGNQVNRTGLYSALGYSHQRWHYRGHFFLTDEERRLNSIYPPLLSNYLSLKEASGGPAAWPDPAKDKKVAMLPGAPYLDSSMRPLQELWLTNNRQQQLYVSTQQTLRYEPVPRLSLLLQYQYILYRYGQYDLRDKESYQVRKLLNASLFNNNGQYVFGLPYGDMLDAIRYRSEMMNARAQAEYQSGKGDFQFNALAGGEWQSNKSGFKNELSYAFGTPQQISQPGERAADSTIIFRGLYTSVTLTVKDRFVLNVSLRSDQSNQFGALPFGKGVFAGVGTRLMLERFSFYPEKWPKLHLLLSTGETGNAGHAVQQRTTIVTNYSGSTPVASIDQPANSRLQPERIRLTNAGFQLRGPSNRYQVFFDYYQKYCYNLQGVQLVNPMAGFTEVVTNNSALRVAGFDVSVAANYGGDKRRHTTSAWLSMVRNRVVANAFPPREVYLLMEPATYQYQPGAAVNTIYAFPEARLDSLTGNPRGYIQGKPSMNYDSIVTSKDPRTLKSMGSAIPVYYGNVNHRVQLTPWLYCSVQVSARFRYFYRRGTYNAAGLRDGINMNGDYYDRWQKKGDELRTFIPSYQANSSANRELFIAYSEHRVQPADNIKIDHVQAGVSLPHVTFEATFFHVGYLWRKNAYKDDPDAVNKPYNTLRSISITVSVHY